MRIVLNLLFVAIALFLLYTLYTSIREPIAFNKERNIREAAVIDKLKEIRQAQEMYRYITGEFAGDFDTLAQVLTEDSFAIIKIIGDPDDPDFTGEIIKDTLLSPAIDSVIALGMNLDSLRYVPFGEPGLTFNISADTLTYQKTLVNVVEVGIPRRKFMGKWGSSHFKRYDQTYSPEKPLKFGDMNAPKLAGNWED
ncbi:MAG: hypothetical protein DWQ02_23800 [Bacteroidetes bacterium]|nr:MAG: hypothetical protein DWQ02_23800 [Bacteroidota bacterium]